MTTTVANFYKDPFDVYIGRAREGYDGYFGNPFPMSKEEDRAQCVADYGHMFYNRIRHDPEFAARIETLRGKRIACFCAPKACHGDVIAAYLNQETKPTPAKGAWVRPEGDLVLAGTGHRPDELGGYGDEVFWKLVKVCEYGLNYTKPNLVVTGMALGFDQALAQACVEMKIPFHAYIPFVGQESRWPFASKQQYKRLLTQAEAVTAVCEPGFAAWKMHKRNEVMVDRSDVLLALYNPAKTSGGTFECLRYAKGKVQALNLWATWASGGF